MKPYSMINLALLKQRGYRLLTGRKSYKDLCDKQWTLCEPETAVCPPAIYLPGQLERVTNVQEETTYADELKRIEGGVVQQGPTIAYQLRDVELHSGYIYKKAMKVVVTKTKESWFNQGETQYISEAALACSYYGNSYFGNWMANDLMLTLLARQLGTPIRTSQKLSPNQIEYMNILDLKSTPLTHAKVKELIIIEDDGRNRLKRERYEYIRGKIKSLCSPGTHPGVMFLRGKSGQSRYLINENEIADFLKNQGFTIIDPEKTSAREIICQSLGAKIIVGVEGSQLANGLFTVNENGAFFTLQPPYRFNNVYKERTDYLGLKYAFVIGKEVANGFEISLDEFAKTLDALYSRLN